MVSLGGFGEIAAVPPGPAARPEAASSVAPVSHRYERSLRPCLGTTIAPLRRAAFHQALLERRVQDARQRARHLGEIERRDEIGGVADFSAAAAAHEAPELLLDGLALPRRLLLECSEGLEVAPKCGDALDRGGPNGPNQFILEVSDADVETEALHVGACQVRPETGPLEAATEVVLLLHVAETGKLESLASIQLEEASDRLGASHRDNADALRFEVATLPLGEGLDRVPVADSLDEQHRSGVQFHMLH